MGITANKHSDIRNKPIAFPQQLKGNTKKSNPLIMKSYEWYINFEESRLTENQVKELKLYGDILECLSRNSWEESTSNPAQDAYYTQEFSYLIADLDYIQDLTGGMQVPEGNF